MPFVDNLQQVPLDPIFELQAAYLADSRPEKVNLGIGLYADRQGHTFVFPVVQAAFRIVNVDDFEYKPIGGNRNFLNELTKFVLGAEINLDEIAQQATCGGTQACRIFGDLIAQDEQKRQMYIGVPTWGNHFAVLKSLELQSFPHLDSNGLVNLNSYLDVVNTAPEGSVLLLHGGLTHNPTGHNLSIEDLKNVLPILEQRKMGLFIDAAYTGLGEGLKQDLDWLRYAWETVTDVAIGFSLSKNASLYEHRAGVLLLKTKRKTALESQLQKLARESVSMAPGIPQEMILNILESETWTQQWVMELEAARQDLLERKTTLLTALPPQFHNLKDAHGMFALLPLSKEQIDRLQTEFAIYIPPNGRINFGGLKMSDIPKIAQAIRAVTSE